MADYKSLAEIPLDEENGGLFYAPQVKCILKNRGFGEPKSTLQLQLNTLVVAHHLFQIG